MRWILLIAALSAAACANDPRPKSDDDDDAVAISNDDDSESPAESSGVDGFKAINELGADELGKLCDWYASLLGGYEYPVCENGTTILATSGNRDLCVSNALNNTGTCEETVATWEACAKSLTSIDPCDDTGAFQAAQQSGPCADYHSVIGACAEIR